MRLGSSIVLSTRTWKGLPTSVVMPNSPLGWRMPKTEAGFPFTWMLRRCNSRIVLGAALPSGPPAGGFCAFATVGNLADAARVPIITERRDSMANLLEREHRIAAVRLAV